jgi:outer membrane beta-barrel protein
MKRSAISLFVCLAVTGWAGTGSAAKKAKPAPAAEAAPAEEAKPAADEAPAEAAAPAADAAPAESLDIEEGKAAKVDEGEIGAAPAAKPTTLSWQDIVVVPRKAFLKGGRVELQPFSGVSINDILIRHYVFGFDFNYFLTDVLWVGLQGQYFVKSLTEREELIGLQYNRIPTLNRYLYGAALNFGYVPVYGKFALFNKSIMHWEIYASAGVGLTRTEIIPRNPGSQTFTNDLLTPNAAIGSRFFLFNWLTVNFSIRDYMFADKFEPTDRVAGEDIAAVKSRAESAFVHNVMFSVGAGIYLPTSFQYKSPR